MQTYIEIYIQPFYLSRSLEYIPTYIYMHTYIEIYIQPFYLSRSLEYIPTYDTYTCIHTKKYTYNLFTLVGHWNIYLHTYTCIHT